MNISIVVASAPLVANGSFRSANFRNSLSEQQPLLTHLRLTGLTLRQILRTTVFEALASTTIGLILGAIAAVLALVGLWAATYRVYGTPVIAIPSTLPDGGDVEGGLVADGELVVAGGDGTVAPEPVDPALHGVPLLVPLRVEGVRAAA
jgi:hypothetical protein